MKDTIILHDETYIKRSPYMKNFSYVITDELGIHARPAGLLVKAAGTCESKITLTKAGKEVDAKKIIAVMSLGAKKGDEVTVTIDGTDEDSALESIKKFFEENL